MLEYDTDFTIADWVFYIFYFGIFVYTLLVMSSYIILGVASALSARNYIYRNKYTRYDLLMKSDVAPKVSILAPAFNEEANIVENVRSLIAINYPSYEVVIINDGSKDSTLKKVIDYFQMVEVPYSYSLEVECKPIRGIYKSTNPAFSRIVLVDKENGGKADALNAGINVARFPYIMNIDVDCILERDCLNKLLKPFLEEDSKRVIATGGVVRIANNCEIENGVIKNVRMPKTLIGRFQTLEYLRAFLLGRMAWSYLDGLLLISGALGVFDKEIVIKSGGYYAKTVGEDMELVVRMRRYCRKNEIPYKVDFIPDPLCWTEVPESWNVLYRQRNRWTRGTIETLLMHKGMFYNPFYGRIGLLSYPYWFFFEWLAPLMEFFGMIMLFIFAYLGLINWPFFFLLLLMVGAFALCISAFTIFIEDKTFFQYKRRRDFWTLIFVALIEPLVFHPFVMFSAIRGNWDYFFEGKKQWGAMHRVGFNKPTENTPSPPQKA